MRRERPRIPILHAQSVRNLVIILSRYNTRLKRIRPRSGEYGARAACIAPALRNPSKGRPTYPEPSFGSDCDGAGSGGDNELTGNWKPMPKRAAGFPRHHPRVRLAGIAPEDLGGKQRGLRDLDIQLGARPSAPFKKLHDELDHEPVRGFIAISGCKGGGVSDDYHIVAINE